MQTGSSRRRRGSCRYIHQVYPHPSVVMVRIYHPLLSRRHRVPRYCRDIHTSILIRIPTLTVDAIAS